MVDGVTVGAEDFFFSGEGADQHEQRGLRKVEVGEKGTHNLEVVSGIDEEIGVAGSGAHSSGALPGGVLKSADRGGANGNHAARFPPGSFDLFGGAFGDGIRLGVKLMLFNRLCADRLEGSEADMEGDFCRFDPSVANAGEDFWREMQSCSGGRN